MKTILKPEDVPDNKNYLIITFEPYREYYESYGPNEPAGYSTVTRTSVETTQNLEELKKRIIYLIEKKEKFVVLDVDKKLKPELKVDIKLDI
jgi:hypothetical protein